MLLDAKVRSSFGSRRKCISVCACEAYRSAVMMSDSGCATRHDEPTVLNTLQSDQAPGEFLDPSGFAMDDEDFQAGIMVEVRMTGRDHQIRGLRAEVRSASRSRHGRDDRR